MVDLREDPSQSVSAIPDHVARITPTELDLSPSKARAHATTAHAWTQVTNWLHDIFDSPASQNASLPPFERNAATLAYLQSLMHANMAANSSRKRLHEAQVEQLQVYEDYYSATASDPGQELFREVADALTPEAQAALESTAKASVSMGYIVAAPEEGVENEDVEIEVRRRILRLSVEVFELEQALVSLKETRVKLEGEEAAVTEKVAQVETGPDREALVASLRQQTAQYFAQTKHLALKTAEYQERIDVLSKEPSQGVSVKVLRQRQQYVQALKETIRVLEEDVREYHGLPPDVEASRAEVRRAHAELETWKRKREEFFEQLAAG